MAGKTFTNKYELLKNVIKQWKLGVEVERFPLTETGDTTKPSQQNSQDLGDIQSTKIKSHEDLPESAPSSTKSEYDFIKMPPKMRKRGRPKGAELTAIGLPKCKRSKDDGQKLLPLSKLKVGEKSWIILECLTGKLAAAECLSGKRLLGDDDL
ncbi:Hypothetical predicted protein [Paramuricea clavata]|uniref:Uncharacterized protein n=1 Tax=Paramuricea clavata TaxID=317549 RepID=A0A6S7JMP4_PARCT|nr:Hypothetical predicted protein [Paramuricea clavata]